MTKFLLHIPLLVGLLLLFGVSAVAVAGELVDGVLALDRGDYATALKEFKEVATRVSPPLTDWLEKARPVNPGKSDAALTAYWRNTYGPASEPFRALAQFFLGGMYDEGKGVVQDYQEAVKWYRRAADQGLAKAQYNLGVLYANGQGVPQDDQEAVKWYRRAAEQGKAKAQYNLGVKYANGQGVSQDDHEAVKWYRLAADQGNAWAQANLGGMYAMGKGVPQDNTEAMKWYRRAA